MVDEPVEVEEREWSDAEWERAIALAEYEAGLDERGDEPRVRYDW